MREVDASRPNDPSILIAPLQQAKGVVEFMPWLARRCSALHDLSVDSRRWFQSQFLLPTEERDSTGLCKSSGKKL